MPNITMAFKEDLLKKARKIAIDKDTTLTGLIRDYLQGLVEQEARLKEGSIDELMQLFHSSKAVVGPRTWTRDDLHARR